MDVVEHEEHATLACRDREQRDNGLEETQLCLRWIDDRSYGLVAELRKELSELATGTPEFRC
jgi:hypothetical protein